MKPRFLRGPSVVGVLLAAAVTVAAEPNPTAKAPPRGDVQALADQIDQHLARRWATTGAQSATQADDAEFLRRVYLDLAGRIPTIFEARAFLDDKRPDKRTRLVEELLAGPRYTAHFTNVWRALLLPEAGNNFQVRLQQPSFEGWLKKQLKNNTGYDRMVRELLTTPLNGGPLAIVSFVEPGPLPYYLAKEFKPENLAGGTARVFLGVNIECAQCHNHPFANWKREQFWAFAAFFSGVKSQRAQDFLLPDGEDGARHELAMPGSGKVVQARFLDGTVPEWKDERSSRATLADWITSKDNPYFARAGANRIWAYFFGTGLVEPLDEMVGANSTNSHPELLDVLAKEFANHDFDIKFLMRAITASRAYQLTSARSHKSQDDPHLFARMPLRGLTGEQLFDSLATATGFRDSGGGDDLLSGLLGGNRSARSEFLTRFTLSERPTEAQTSILQALALMNGKVTADATTLEKSETLAAIAEAPFLSNAERVETLYLAVLSRRPDVKESERAVKYIRDAVRNAKGKDEAARHAAATDALSDLFWVLLNSPEFLCNH